MNVPKENGKHIFDWKLLEHHDAAKAREILGSEPMVESRQPDLIIAPDGVPYLYRWNVTPKDDTIGAQVYLHVQVKDDPDRGLHTHPWDNMSVILSGGYTELISVNPRGKSHDTETIERKKGDVIFRKATHAHRLLMPVGVDHKYTMTIFSAGPVIQEWGFWIVDKDRPSHERNWKWVSSKVLIEQRRVNGVSVQKGVEQ